MPLADGQEIAGYTILRLARLRRAWARCILAQHPRLPRYDALKVLSATVCAESEYRERFNREADIAATLWHPAHRRGARPRRRRRPALDLDGLRRGHRRPLTC